MSTRFTRVKSKTTPLLWVHRKVSFRRVDDVFELRQCCRRMNFVGQRPSSERIGGIASFSMLSSSKICITTCSRMFSLPSPSAI